MQMEIENGNSKDDAMEDFLNQRIDIEKNKSKGVNKRAGGLDLSRIQ